MIVVTNYLIHITRYDQLLILRFQELMPRTSPTIKFLDEDQVDDSPAARKEARRLVFEMDSKDNQGHLKVNIITVF